MEFKKKAKIMEKMAKESWKIMEKSWNLIMEKSWNFILENHR